jgi:uncharacterized protein (DUF2147 family)
MTRILALTALLLSMAGAAAAQTDRVQTTPAGLWRTFDDHTGRERGLVRIIDTSGTLTGIIAGTIDPTEGARSCDHCTDDRKGRPILGLTIITGMHRDDAGWSGGHILDPETGSVYRCSMKLRDGGQTLVLRGYLGISLFGRSQTWRRAS